MRMLRQQTVVRSSTVTAICALVATPDPNTTFIAGDLNLEGMKYQNQLRRAIGCQSATSPSVGTSQTDPPFQP
jgi:hypothetical protein